MSQLLKSHFHADATATDAIRMGSLNEALAALAIVSIPVGSTIGQTTIGQQLTILITPAIGILLTFNLIATGLSGSTSDRLALAPAAIIASFIFVLGSLPLIFTPNLTTGLLGFVLFTSGTITGLGIGVVLRYSGASQPTMIDAALFVFLGWTTFQLGTNYLRSDNLLALHGAAETPWGRSNYVAGVLVVVSFLVIARIQQVCLSRVWFVVPFLAVLASLLSFSRGAILAFGAAAIVLLWSWSRRWRFRVIVRAIIPVAVFGVYKALDLAVSTRYVNDSQAGANIDARFGLYQTAWEDFRSSPFLGTGWLSFRESADSQSYAHNFFLSFLQIGGIAMIPYVIIVCVLAFRVFFSEPLLAPAIAGAAVIAMTDPFLEATVASLIVFTVLSRGIWGRVEPDGRGTRLSADAYARMRT